MNDEELLKQFRESKEPALLEELIRRNFDRVYRFVASMLGKQDDVDDLVQSVLLNVVRNIDQFRGESRFSTWIYQITANRVRRHWETAQKSFPVLDPHEMDCVCVSGVDALEAEELKSLLDTAIAELSPALRAAILLTCVEGLSPEEAAQVEGCSAANIHWRVHKARKILKEKLQHYQES